MIYKHSHLLKKSNYKSTKPVMMSCELIHFFFLKAQAIKSCFPAEADLLSYQRRH